MEEIKKISTGMQIKIKPELLKESEQNSFSMDDVEEMKSSIKSVGLLTPLTVVGPNEDSIYTIISGHRRFRAIKELIEEGYYGLSTIPCLLYGNKEDTKNFLKQKLLIEIANIESRDITHDERERHRLAIVEIVMEMVKDEDWKSAEVVRQLASYMKVSRRYAAMYKQVFENASDVLLEYFKNSENAKMSDLQQITKINDEGQKKYVETIEQIESPIEKNKYTEKVKKEVRDKIKQKVDSGIYNKKEKIELTDDELADIPRFTMEDVETTEDDIDFFDKDQSGLLKSMKAENQKQDQRKKQESINTVIQWCESMIKNRKEPTTEEAAAIEACKNLVDVYVY